jgi:hypothetical protein
MDTNFQTNAFSNETSVEELPETCIDAVDFKVRKETTISHYEVSDGSSSWWETIFYTENWGSFKSAVQRYNGFNCTPYKDKLKELMQLLSNLGVKAELANDNYRLILRLKSKSDVRVDYAFKNRGRPATKKSPSELGQ